MHKAIVVWAALLLVGPLSVVQSYVDRRSHDYQVPLSRRRAESADSNEWPELSQLARAAKFAGLYEASDESADVDEEKRGEVAYVDALGSPCKPGQLSYVAGKCSCPVGPIATPCAPETRGLCSASSTKYTPPATLITFGSGSSKYSTATPASLGISTAYTQVTSNAKTVHDGSFAFVNEAIPDASTWFGGAPDHTIGSTTATDKGYMMLVNANYAAGTVFWTAINNLVVGLRYEYSAFFANIVKAGTRIILPNLKFEIRTVTPDNTLIASATTGGIPETASFTWKKYGGSFVTPVTAAYLSIITIAPGGSGNDFAIDDVTVVPCASVDNAVCTSG